MSFNLTPMATADATTDLLSADGAPRSAPQTAARATATPTTRPALAEVVSALWADLDAHARLRHAQESSASMQSRQRFD